jgi:large subunit ribosomal protein L10
MAKQLKQILASQVFETIKDREGAVFVNVAPMTVELSTRFRTFLDEKAGGARLRFIHNRTARKAFEQAGWPAEVAGVLKGPTAIIFGGEGTAKIAKSLTEWSRTDKTLVVKGAVAEGEYFDGKAVGTTLAKLPDKDTMRAMLLSAVLGPARALAVLAQAPGASLARALQARVDQDAVPAQA